MSENNIIRTGDFMLVAIPYDDCDGEQPVSSLEIEFDDLRRHLPVWLAECMELRGVERSKP